MSLTNEPERLTVTDSRRATVQWVPRRRSITRRTVPATAPRTEPPIREREPWTEVRVAVGPRAPARPAVEIRARAELPEDVGVLVTGGTGVFAGGTGVGGFTAVGGASTGGSGVGVGAGIGTSTAPVPPASVTDWR